MLKEFKEFAVRGNVMDMAVGVIIGAALAGVVSSLVDDMIMPPIGLLLANVDFSNLFITLSGPLEPTLEAAREAGAVTLNYGLFLNSVIEFMIIAFIIFLMVKWVNKLKTQAPPPDTNTKQCPYCFTSIPKKATRCPNCTSKLG